MFTPPNANNQISQSEKPKMKKIKSLSFNCDDKNYIFTIFTNEKLICFMIDESNSYPYKKYDYISSFESLKKLNKYFLIFENIDECADTIIKGIENKIITFKIEDNICEMIILNLINNKTFSINIPEVEKDIKNNINDMTIIIQELISKVSTLENKNNHLEERIKTIEEENINIKNELLLLKQLENEKVNLFPNSSIITNNDQNIIINFLEKKPKKCTLLFDTVIHGDKNETFHQNVNYKSPTLIIIKTTNGLKFGGYTTKCWPNNNSYLNDKYAFIFSLNKKKKYNIIDENKSAIYGCSNQNSYMFVFGKGHDICIYNNCTQNNNNHVDKSEYNTYEQYELNNGTKNFIVSSLEVYEVKY